MSSDTQISTNYNSLEINSSFWKMVNTIQTQQRIKDEEQTKLLLEEQRKKTAGIMNSFLKEEILDTVERKLNPYFAPRLFNRFGIYEVAKIPQECFKDLIEGLPKYNAVNIIKRPRPPKKSQETDVPKEKSYTKKPYDPKGEYKPVGVDMNNIACISIGQFKEFFHRDVAEFQKKAKGGDTIKLFAPMILMYRPGTKQLLVGLKKAPVLSNGKIGQLVQGDIGRK